VDDGHRSLAGEAAACARPTGVRIRENVNKRGTVLEVLKSFELTHHSIVQSGNEWEQVIPEIQAKAIAGETLLAHHGPDVPK